MRLVLKQIQDLERFLGMFQIVRPILHDHNRMSKESSVRISMQRYQKRKEEIKILKKMILLLSNCCQR